MFVRLLAISLRLCTRYGHNTFFGIKHRSVYTGFSFVILETNEREIRSTVSFLLIANRTPRTSLSNRCLRHKSNHSFQLYIHTFSNQIIYKLLFRPSFLASTGK